MRNDFCTGYLMHHGIQGQKWGVKNGPPYPLKSSQKSSVEKQHGRLTDKQKKAIKTGAVVLGSAALAYAGYKFVSNPGARNFVWSAMNGGKKKQINKINKMLDGIGPEIVKKPVSKSMKMDLQYFSNRKHNPSKFPALSIDDVPKGANLNKAVSEALHWKRDKIKNGETFVHYVGDFGYILKGDGEGYGAEVLDVFPIPDADTGLFPRK